MARLTIDASMPMVIDASIDQDGTVGAVMDRDPNLYNRLQGVGCVLRNSAC
jgi:hypothetical protein